MANIVSFNREIVTNELKNFYILTGEEIGLMNLYINQIRGEVRRESSVGPIWRTLTQKGLIAKHSTYVVRDDEEFIKNEKLTSLLPTVKYGTLILLITNPSKCKKLLKTYADNVIEFERMTNEQLINHFSKQYKSVIPTDIVKEVVYLCENDFSRIANELDKLSRVNTADLDWYEAVDTLVFVNLEFKVFDAVDSVLKYQVPEALKQVDTMFKLKESAMGFLTILYNNFTSAVKVLGTKDPKQSTVNVPQFIINKLKYDFQYSYQSAVDAMEYIGDTIEGIKQGRYEEKSGTYLCLYRIFSLD